MRLFLKDMEVLYKGLPHPKGEMSVFVPEIVLRLPEEQANTISKVKLNKTGFYGFG